MKILMASFIVVPVAALTPGDVWGLFADGLNNLIAVLVLVAGLWASIGRPVKKRFDEERKERAEEKQARIEREKTIDNAFEEQRQMTAEWRQEYSRNEEENKRILEELKANDARHDLENQLNREALAELRGEVHGAQRERDRFTQLAAAAQLLHDATKEEENPA